ncbi:TetR family transcriptional regulator [Paeniglutamicibacter sp. NPDC012692]|uniref:TetR family transcriptional regulator n=1 Tax=Paeniglutamicibacter sp. NPDC012692 TaxID=3364388 RepID=UPI0036A5E5B4
MSKSTLREVSRQAMRQRIGEIAEDLFVSRGYDATTVEDIAREAGISERTFFRYFASKAEVLFLRFEVDTHGLVEAIEARPPDEAPWLTLRYALESALENLDQESVAKRAALFRKITETAPQILAQYFARVHASQQELCEVLWTRWKFSHQADADTRVVFRALVSSVFAVLNEVELATQERPLAERRRMFREALDAVRPAREDLAGKPN